MSWSLKPTEGNPEGKRKGEERVIAGPAAASESDLQGDWSVFLESLSD